MTVRDKLTETMTVVKRVRDMRVEAEDLVKQAKESRRGRRPEAIALLDNAMKDLNNRLYTIEERLVQYRAKANQDLIANPTGIDSKLAQLLGFASMGDGPPTDGIEGPAEASDRRASPSARSRSTGWRRRKWPR